jgi:hypothetical protein
MKWHRFGTFVLVVLLLVVAVNPVVALTGSNNNNASSRSDPHFVPALAAGYVILDGEVIIEILAGGAVIGAAWTHVPDISRFVSDIVNFMAGVLSAFATFLTQGSTHTTVTVDGYTVDMCKDRTKVCTDAMHRFDYTDDKNKGLPVGGNHGEAPDFHTMPLAGNAYSSKYLFNCQIDKDNGCPKQIRYYGKDGKPDLDIDFSHGMGDDTCAESTLFPHLHPWINGVRSKDHIRAGIDEIFRNWRCKKYNYYRGIWCP